MNGWVIWSMSFMGFWLVVFGIALFWRRPPMRFGIYRNGVRLPDPPSNLSFEGNGKVKVDVDALLRSARVQEQIKAARSMFDDKH